jgi:4-amino-4-deoxy-L-arabinose transferase-like glycosyltransferase
VTLDYRQRNPTLGDEFPPESIQSEETGSGDTASGWRRCLRLHVIGIIAVVLLGVVLRALILRYSLGALDSDEAVTALVGKRFIERGETPIFYWSAPYGGTIEALLTGVAFRLFGESALVLKLVSIAWHCAAAVLTWRIGRRLIDERAGVLAGLILWIWPGNYVWWSTKSRGYYGVVLVTGLVIVLCSLRLIEHHRSVRDWVILGLCFGIGWWSIPQIMYLAAPAFLWLIVRNRRALLWAPVALPSALLGAAPWLWWNLHNRWDSIRVRPNYLGETHLESFLRFWREAVPMALGLRVPFSLRWLVPALAIALYVAFLAFGIWSLVTRRRGVAFLALGIGLYPFLFALSPMNLTVEGRYLFCMSPLIALLVAQGLRTRRAIIGGLSLLTAVTTMGLVAISDGLSPSAPDIPTPIRMGPLLSRLEAMNVQAGYADYWIAYRVTFESGEQIVVDGSNNSRFWPYHVQVRNSPRAAWIFVEGSGLARNLVHEMGVRRLSYEEAHIGGFSVYVPSVNLPPEAVPCVRSTGDPNCPWNQKAGRG